MSSSPTADEQLLRQQHEIMSPTKSSASSSSSGGAAATTAEMPTTTSASASASSSGAISESGSSICSDKPVTTAFFNDHIIVDVDAGTSAQIKRLRSNDIAASAAATLEACASMEGGGGGGGGVAPSHISLETCSNNSMSSPSPLDYVNNPGHIFQQQAAAAAAAAAIAGGGIRGGSTTTCNATSVAFMHHFQQNMQTLLRPSLVDLACSYFGRPQPLYPPQHTSYAAVTAAQHQQEAMAGAVAGLAPQQSPPAPSVVPPFPPLLPHLSLVGGGGGGGGGGGCDRGELLANRVTAINSNTTSDCITNDADLSSSDSSLIQDDTMLLPTTPATPTNAVDATGNCCPSSNDALPQSPSCNTAHNHHHQPQHQHQSNSAGPGSNGRKKGFSISAILGGGS